MDSDVAKHMVEKTNSSLDPMFACAIQVQGYIYPGFVGLPANSCLPGLAS
jgi:hypothetical protein